MGKLKQLNNLLDFLPELFPPDLVCITLSNTTHFINIWWREGNELGESLGKYIYPGKKLELNVMLGLVAKHKKKITKYYTKEESISGFPYLAVGVPVYEDGQIVGGICAVREETILETQERCKDLFQFQEVLADSMKTVSANISHLINSYQETRTIANYVQDISQKAHLLGINALMTSSFSNKENPAINEIVEELKELAIESKETAGKIVGLLNDYDNKNMELFSSIYQIQTAVSNMSHCINNIMEYLQQQSNLIINGEENYPHQKDFNPDS